jgi:hypothetical protein
LENDDHITCLRIKLALPMGKYGHGRSHDYKSQKGPNSGTATQKITVVDGRPITMMQYMAASHAIKCVIGQFLKC